MQHISDNVVTVYGVRINLSELFRKGAKNDYEYSCKLIDEARKCKISIIQR